MSDPETLARMRAEWNERAREDANYYVAFGRRQQEDEEFFASSADVVRGLVAELKRLREPGQPQEYATALEIGCGPGRLIRPMSGHLREIHGVDISDEMIRLASEKLRDVPNARVHHSPDSDLSMFPDESFDFVYSYAVFQHIPSREVVFRYLSEARRVLKRDGILRCQINGLPESARLCSTWEGVRIPARDVAEFARNHDFQLLALDGISTQYMWTTWRKRMDGWRDWLEQAQWDVEAGIRNVSGAHTGEPLVPAAGQHASASLWVESLPQDCDLNDLEIRFDGRPGRPSYIGPPQWGGVSQVNVALPQPIRTGLVPVEVFWLRKPLCQPVWLRIIPPGPAIPKFCSATDGINLLSGIRIVTGCIKVVIEEVSSPESFRAWVGGEPVRDTEFFCTDPLLPRYEVNFRLPENVAAGRHQLEMRLGHRTFGSVAIEVA